MKPSEIRERLLDEHAELRLRIASVRAELDREHRETATDELLALLETLLRHVDHEDSLLPKVLTEDYAYGVERLEVMFAHHREQREQIESWRGALKERDAVGRVFEIIERALMDDMRHEEEHLLNQNVLHDDLVQVDIGA